MRSGAYNAGQFNLKGKKEKRLSCGCCICLNLKDKYKKYLDIKEIREALVSQLVRGNRFKSDQV